MPKGPRQKDIGPFDMERVVGGRLDYWITCNACRTTETLPNQNFSASTARDILFKKFRERGWHVGSRRTKHICPSCREPDDAPGHTDLMVTPESIDAFVEANPLPTIAEELDAVLTPAITPAHANYPLPSVAAPAPAPVSSRRASVEERRIINERLLNVYGDRGYKFGWSDARVADDLGAPVEWVKEVREFSFGPDLDEVKLAADKAALAAKAEAEAAFSELLKLVNETADKMSARLTAARTMLDEAKELVSRQVGG